MVLLSWVSDFYLCTVIKLDCTVITVIKLGHNNKDTEAVGKYNKIVFWDTGTILLRLFLLIMILSQSLWHIAS